MTTTAIQTRFLPATNYKPARIVAETLAQFGGNRPVRVIMSYSFDGDASHHNTAKHLIAKLGWNGQWHAGGTGNGFVYVKSPAGEFTFETVGE